MTSNALNDDLRDTLEQQLRQGSRNAAMERLLDDYARYHLVLVVLGGVFLVALGFLSIVCWRRYLSARRRPSEVGRFERRTYLGFGLITACVGLLLAAIVAGNVTNARNPDTGFAGALPAIGSAQPNSQRADLQHAFQKWLITDGMALPPQVTQAVDDRLAWQRPKAIISAVLLVVVFSLGLWAWRWSMRRRRSPAAKRGWVERSVLLVGVLAVPACLVLMAMVLGNTQASIAPLAITLFYG